LRKMSERILLGPPRFPMNHASIYYPSERRKEQTSVAHLRVEMRGNGMRWESMTFILQSTRILGFGCGSGVFVVVWGCAVACEVFFCFFFVFVVFVWVLGMVFFFCVGCFVFVVWSGVVCCFFFWCCGWFFESLGGSTSPPPSHCPGLYTRDSTEDFPYPPPLS